MCKFVSDNEVSSVTNTMTSMKRYVVVCGVIVIDGEVLCMRRGVGHSASTSEKWEFPGGKIEDGESAEEALQRELLEEMDYEVEMLGHLATVEHEYNDFQVRLSAYLCGARSREFVRKEHSDHKWIPIGDSFENAEIMALDWAQADYALLASLDVEEVNRRLAAKGYIK